MSWETFGQGEEPSFFVCDSGGYGVAWLGLVTIIMPSARGIWVWRGEGCWKLCTKRVGYVVDAGWIGFVVGFRLLFRLSSFSFSRCLRIIFCLLLSLLVHV